MYKIQNAISPIKVFPDLNWFLQFSGDKTECVLSDLLPQNGGFDGNRFLIPGPNKVDYFSIPLQKKSIDTKVSQILIVNQSKWARELKNALQTTYGKTPYFEHYEHQLWDILDNLESDNFLELAQKTLLWAHSALQWEIKIVLAEQPFCTEVNKRVFSPYSQPFADRFGFVENAPIFDLLFSLGPEAGVFLERL